MSFTLFATPTTHEWKICVKGCITQMYISDMFMFSFKGSKLFYDFDEIQHGPKFKLNELLPESQHIVL